MQAAPPLTAMWAGVAVSEDTLYVSGQKQNGLYTICAIPLKDLPAEGSHEVKLEQTIPVPVSPSFLSDSHGYLMGGKFLPPGRGLPPLGRHEVHHGQRRRRGLRLLHHGL